MVRKIIKIDEDKCNGCGLCVSACHEGAIGLVDGKARLLRDDYCDGLGNCLPVCPMEAISFEEREAAGYDEAAVAVNAAAGAAGAAGADDKVADPHGTPDAHFADAPDRETTHTEPLPCGCPGTNAKAIERDVRHGTGHAEHTAHAGHATHAAPPAETHLNQWPVQIKLVPPNAPYFNNAHLLVAADCAAYAYGGFHKEYMRNRITLIGCPKLDEGDYSEKLTAILKANTIKTVTVARMEVPCCGGIENAVRTALRNCGKMIPWQVVTISTDGRILED